MRNDLALLNMLMADMKQAPELYRPTNYWRHYQKPILKWLINNGLWRFRDYSTGICDSFGAGTALSKPLSPNRLTSLIRRFLPGSLDLVAYQQAYLREQRARHEAQYHLCAALDPRISHIADSGEGMPFDLFTVNGKDYTAMFLRAFEHVAWIGKHVDLKTVHTVAEIGAGYGASAEAYCKLYPQAQYWVYDIPPTIYASGQYLKAVFPDEVYDYRDFKAGRSAKGFRIVALPTWCMETVKPKADLFINCASFQEMEKEVVANYYRQLCESAEWVYLWEEKHGTYKKTSGRSGGAVDPVTGADYAALFSGHRIEIEQDHHRPMYPYVRLLMRRAYRTTAANVAVLD